MEENNKIVDSTLEINEPKANNKIEIENNNDNEGLPILSQLEPVDSSSIGNYYRINYPQYRVIKFHNFTFIKMGNLLTFNFDNNNIPKLSIGPHWYLTIVLFLLILTFEILLYVTIFIQTSSLKIIIFFFLFFSVYYFLIKTALTHVQVVMNKKKNIDTYGYCNICHVYFNPDNKVEHCEYCGVCVEKMDHHCVWMGKCVAKNNIIYFYLMIANFGALYVYIIFCSIHFALTKK